MMKLRSNSCVTRTYCYAIGTDERWTKALKIIECESQDGELIVNLYDYVSDICVASIPAHYNSLKATIKGNVVSLSDDDAIAAISIESPDPEALVNEIHEFLEDLMLVLDVDDEEGNEAEIPF